MENGKRKKKEKTASTEEREAIFLWRKVQSPSLRHQEI
jgi:hypothetical protein